jgi:hypothetical protein
MHYPVGMVEQPTDMEVRDALTRTLSSPAFAHAWRAREFLQFVTEESLAGRAGALTGYSIARQVFGDETDTALFEGLALAGVDLR